jgi:hypothetical protein
MSDYLAEIGFAANSLLAIIWAEDKRLQELEHELALLKTRVEANYGRAEFVARNSEDADDVAMAAGMHWENYFGDDKQYYQKNMDRKNLSEQIEAHEFSIGSLAGSLLQYAKQGISIGHGGLATCTNGRLIGSQFLKDVIWQGRNQAIHWEDGNPRPGVQQCFDLLTSEISQVFAEYRTRNMAFDVVRQLEWTELARFNADLLSLG